MALFGKKKTSEKKEVSAPVVVKGEVDTSVIIRPLITEKAAILNDKRVYAFEIAPRAGKREVRNAVMKLWGVAPTKINIVRRAPRQFVLRSRNRMSTLSGLKKAYVFLKEGDRIELV